MQVNSALILSAGFGTRMGEIGKRLPKVLWPVFEKTLLDLQIAYARSLKIRKIFINTHFLHEQIARHVQKLSDNDIIVVHETPDILDVGGAICHISSHPALDRDEVLLILNGDLFYFFDPLFWENALRTLKTTHAVLFGVKVPGLSNYNETLVMNNQLLEIKKHTGAESYLTYSGMGLVNLKKLLPQPGPSKFFDSVANYRRDFIAFHVPEHCEYWDFGSCKQFYEMTFKLLQARVQGEQGAMMDLCSQAQIFSQAKICPDRQSYGMTEKKSVINYTQCSIQITNSIYMKAGQGLIDKGAGLYYENLFEKI